MQFIIIGIVFVLPFRAEAAYFTRTEDNRIEVSGDCRSNGVDVLIRLSEARNASKTVYTAGSSCANGKFLFSDDLTKWHFPDGRYVVTVNGEKTGKAVEKKSDAVEVRDDAEPSETKRQDASSSDVPGVERVSEPKVNFLEAFATLQQSLADMRLWLADSEYPEPMKVGLDAAIDGVDLAAGKIADLLFASESAHAATTDGSETTGKVQATENATISQGEASGTADATTTSIREASDLATTSIDAGGLLTSGGLSVSP